MLKLYNTNGVEEYPLTDIENFYITHVFEGMDTINFDISPGHPLYKKIGEEIKVSYGDNDYLIKAINRRKAVSTVTCELDLDFLKETFHKKYNSGSKTIVEILTSILPAGWSILNQSLGTVSKTIELEGVNNYDIFLECQNTYDLVYEINKKDKTVKLVNPDDTMNYGTYFTDELNLTQLEFKGSTTDFVTRLYPYGKDDLTIKNVNSGVEYVENFSYTNKIISAIWKDEKYTSAQNLKDAALKKIAELAYPVRSYTCTVLDLAKTGSEYSFLTIRMYDRVTLIDRENGIRVEHKVVEYKEYPEEPEKNIITLSTVPKKIQTSIKSVSAQIEKANYEGGFMQRAIKTATELITGQSGGYVVLDPAEKPERILIMNTDNKETATKVWQWNLSGLGYSSNGIQGPYGLAMTMNGQIVADYVATGTLSSILIQSDNYIANTRGMRINLNNGTIDSRNFKIAEDGTVTISSSSIPIPPSHVSQLTNDSGYQNSGGVTTIIGNTVTTGYVNALRITAGRIVVPGVFDAVASTGYVYIGGWNVISGAIYNGIPYNGAKNSNSTGMGTYGSNWAFWAGNGKFSVKQTGSVVLEDVVMNGGSTSGVTCKIHDISNQYWTDLFGSGIQLRRNGYGNVFSINYSGATCFQNASNQAVYSAMYGDSVVVVANGSGYVMSASGVSPSSLAELKANIVKQENFLDDVMNTDVYEFEYKGLMKEGVRYKKYGFIIGDNYNVSDKVLAENKQGVELYSSIGVLWGGVKELSDIVSGLEERIGVLENG